MAVDSSDSDQADERSPAELVADLLPHCAPFASADAASALQRWDEQRDTVADLYQCNLHAEGRSQLASLSYDVHWRPLLRHCVSLLPLVADVAAAPDRSLGAARALAVTRLLVIMRNLCPTPHFQRRLRADVMALLADGSAALHNCATAVRALERAIAQDSCVKEPRLLVKSLLQLWANMLTPSGGRSDAEEEDEQSDGAWLWVQTALYPAVLAPLLTLHRDLIELASIATAIVHHALLCHDADTTYSVDLRTPTRAAVAAMLTTATASGEQRLFPQLLDATVQLVETQLQAVYDDEPEGPSKAPLSVWDWKPHQREPAWLVHVINLAMRSCPDFLSSLQPQLSAQQWCMVMRLVEVWSESLQESEDLTIELKRMQSAAADSTHATAAAAQPQQRTLVHTAEAVASNASFLVQWLQQRPHEPLPVTVLPPSKPSAAAAAPSPAATAASSSSTFCAAAAAAAAVPPVATSSVPLDNVTNSLLHSLGHLLLFEVWSGNAVFEALRDALAARGCAALLLELLSAADTKDGGAMFSDLYRPAGHTRHTKRSDDPQAYVNQFGGGGEATAAAAAAGAATPASAAAASASARPTPYMLKSNLIRLIASLSFRSRLWQDAFGGGGVYACMNHSVLDDHNPLMREYAILALRNLLDQHEQNQAIVAELRVDAIANQQNLQGMGVSTEIDEQTGKIRIGSQSKQNGGGSDSSSRSS